MARILIFGDSIAYGAWDAIGGGWADRLKKYYMKKSLNSPGFYCEIYNLGIDGDISENLLKRLESEIKQRVYKGEDIIVIFAIGVNDSCFAGSKNIFLVTEDKFRENAQKLIEIAGKYASKVVFAGLTPVEESKTNPIPRSATGKCYKNIYIGKYDEIIKSICRKKDIYFIDVFSKFNKLNYEKLLEDGLHPNAEGHKKMFEIVRDFLAENKIT